MSDFIFYPLCIFGGLFFLFALVMAIRERMGK